MSNELTVTKCKGCEYKPMCAISKSDDWFCADAKPLSNAIVEAGHYFTFISEACASCSNHPKNGGSGICNCILGGLHVTC